MSAYKSMTPAERASLDSFYAGMSVAIWAMFYPELRDDSGGHSVVREAIGAVDAHEFYLWARRTNDLMLPWLRRHVRLMARYDRDAAALSALPPRGTEG